LTSELGFEHGVRTAGTATQAFVIELYQLANKRCQDLARGQVYTLDMSKVAGILNRDEKVERLDLGEGLHVIGEPFLDVEHTC